MRKKVKKRTSSLSITKALDAIRSMESALEENADLISEEASDIYGLLRAYFDKNVECVLKSKEHIEYSESVLAKDYVLPCDTCKAENLCSAMDIARELIKLTYEDE